MKNYTCCVNGKRHFTTSNKEQAFSKTKSVVEENYGKVEFPYGTIVEEENGDVWTITINEQTTKARIIKN